MQPGEKIKKKRLEKEITQVELGKKMGCSQRYISDIERGRQKPSREFLIKINEALGLSADYILGLNTNKEVDEIWPTAVREDQTSEYKISEIKPERRLLENTPKRKLIDNVIKILESRNKKVVRALKSNIDAFLSAIEPGGPEVREGD